MMTQSHNSTNLFATRPYWKLEVSAFFLAIMVLLRDLGFVGFPPLSFLIVISISCLVLPFRQLIVFFFYYIPFCFSIHGVGLLPIIIFLVVKSKRINVWQVVFSVTLLVLELIHFVSYDFEVDFIKYLIYAAYVFLFFFVLFTDGLDRQSITLGIRHFVIGTIVVLFIITIHSIVYYGFNDILLGAMRLGGDTDHYDIVGEADITIMNANTYAFFSITALSLVLFSKKGTFSILERILFSVCLIVTGILSTSRTWLFITVLTLIVFFLFSDVKKKVLGVIIVAVLFIISIKYTEYTNNFIDRFANRLENRENLMVAGGRTTLFAAYNEFMMTHPKRIVYGTGVVYYKQVCNVYNSVHSGLQQIYVCYGVLGLFIFIFAGWMLQKRYFIHSKFHLWDWIPFIICLIFDQSIQFLMPHALMFPFLAVILPLRLKNGRD